MNNYSNFIEIINSKNIGDLISRKDILTCPSVDNYRNMLTICGYLEFTNKRGVYKILKHVPTDLSSNKLVKEAYKPINKRFNLKTKQITY